MQGQRQNASREGERVCHVQASQVGCSRWGNCMHGISCSFRHQAKGWMTCMVQAVSCRNAISSFLACVGS